MKNFKLYHLSLYPVKNNLFVPRIPSVRFVGENNNIPRICFSTSIEGCISAIPGGINSMKVLLKNEHIEGIYLYEIDSSQIKLENIKTPMKLLKEGLVPDALWTDECWAINQKVKCKKPKLIKIKDIQSKIGNVNEKKCIEYATYVEYEVLTENNNILEKHIWRKETFIKILNICKKNNIECKYQKLEKAGYAIIIENYKHKSYQIWELLLEDYWLSLEKDMRKSIKKTYTRNQILQVMYNSYFN